jgi:hypothetical protein
MRENIAPPFAIDWLICRRGGKGVGRTADLWHAQAVLAQRINNAVDVFVRPNAPAIEFGGRFDLPARNQSIDGFGGAIDHRGKAGLADEALMGFGCAPLRSV